MKEPSSPRGKSIGVAIGLSVIFFGLELLVQVLPIASTDKIPWFFGLGFVDFALLFAYLDDVRDRLHDVVLAVGRFAKITPMRQRELYPKLGPRLAKADSASITYLDTRNPLDDNDRQRAAYYKEFCTIIKQHSIPVRRIDRGHPNVLPWIVHVVEQLRNIPHFSYRIWRDDQPQVDSIEAISVTVIDGRYTYLVAVGTQQEYGDFRDVEVDSEEFAAIWTKYYDKLWNHPRCISLIERGLVNDAALQSLRKVTQAGPKAGGRPRRR